MPSENGSSTCSAYFFLKVTPPPSPEKRKYKPDENAPYFWTPPQSPQSARCVTVPHQKTQKSIYKTNIL